MAGDVGRFLGDLVTFGGVSRQERMERMLEGEFSRRRGSWAKRRKTEKLRKKAVLQRERALLQQQNAFAANNPKMGTLRGSRENLGV